MKRTTNESKIDQDFDKIINGIKNVLAKGLKNSKFGDIEDAIKDLKGFDFAAFKMLFEIFKMIEPNLHEGVLATIIVEKDLADAFSEQHKELFITHLTEIIGQVNKEMDKQFALPSPAEFKGVQGAAGN